MDKSVLLVLLCLQAFLLITAFTSTDAAALVTDHQQQQSADLEGTAEKGVGKLLIRTKRDCRRRIRACGGRDKGTEEKGFGKLIIRTKRDCNNMPGACKMRTKHTHKFGLHLKETKIKSS